MPNSQGFLLNPQILIQGLVNAPPLSLAGQGSIYFDSTLNHLYYSESGGAYTQFGSGGGGSGTVTTLSVVTANGVSGVVANPTTTPAITLTLGAITPTTINGLTVTSSTGTLTVPNGTTLNTGAGGTLGSNAFLSTAFVPTTTTVNAKALSGNITLGLASSDFVNQGTTTTLLHGNAAGNPSFTTVGINDVSGSTGTGNFVFATSPTLVTPLLGTPTSGALTNCTGLPEGGLSLTDITTANVSTAAHGFAPKLDNVVTHFLNGQGGYTVPTGAVASVAANDSSLTISPTTGAVLLNLNLANANTFTQAQGVNLSSAAAFFVGPNGNTNPVVRIITNVASQADGISISGGAAGVGTTIVALSSGSASPITLTPKGAASVLIGDGTATNPSIAFGSSTNTGFYKAAGTVGVTSGGNPIWVAGTSTFRLLNTADFGFSTAPATTGNRTNVSEIVAGVVGIGTGAVGSRAGWIEWSGQARLTADATNATATFSNLTDLTISNLQAGRKYTGRMTIKCNNSQAAEGIKFDMNGGTATMTSFWAAAGILASGGTDSIGTNIATSLAGVINFTMLTGETVVVFDITFVVNGAGTIMPRFAENSSTAGTATAELGSFVILNDSPN